MFALLNVYKPRGMSSYDVIRLLKRLLGKGSNLQPPAVAGLGIPKIGHAGTLDPAAEGVLVVCLGPATRLAEIIQQYDKQYETLAQLGATSTTDDAEGLLAPVPDAPRPALEQIEQTVRRYVGPINQVPPAHSAVMVAGQRAYRLARRGQQVELAGRTVTVHALEITEYAWPQLSLRVTCGSGTYIRSLVRDIGRELGCGGYCLQIIRTAIGPFTAERAVRLEQLESDGLASFLLPPAEAFPPHRRIVVSPRQAQELLAGRAVQRPENLPAAANASDMTVGVCLGNGELIAVARIDGEHLRPVKVLAE